MVDGEDGGEDRADAHGGEDGVGLREREVVLIAEDERDGREGEVEDCPAEGDPEREPEDDGLGQEEVEGAVERDSDHLAYAAALFVRLDFPSNALRHLFHVGGVRGHVEAVVASRFSSFVPPVECFGFAAQENAPPGLSEEDTDECDHDAACDRL